MGKLTEWPNNYNQYNGKEVVLRNNLEWNDYGARYYDPQIGRWHTEDPLADDEQESFSIYHYGACNPVNTIDPTGMKVKDIGDRYRITEDDVYNYFGYIKDIAAGKGSMDNLMKGLQDAASKNEGEGGRMSSTADETVIKGTGGGIKQKQENNLNEGDIALTFKGDKRVYEEGNTVGKVDCSRFTGEVTTKSGYQIPRTAFEQANWYKKHGEWSSSLKNVRKGDHIFWERGKGKYHTGVVTYVSRTSGNSTIKVMQAQVNKYKPGAIKEQTLLPNGEIPYFNQPFVGVGRYKK